MAVTMFLNNIKEEEFILAHSFRDFSQWSLGFVASEAMCGKTEHHGRAAYFMVDRQEMNKEEPYNEIQLLRTCFQ